MMQEKTQMYARIYTASFQPEFVEQFQAYWNEYISMKVSTREGVQRAMLMRNDETTMTCVIEFDDRSIAEKADVDGGYIFEKINELAGGTLQMTDGQVVEPVAV